MAESHLFATFEIEGPRVHSYLCTYKADALNIKSCLLSMLVIHHRKGYVEFVLIRGQYNLTVISAKLHISQCHP